MIAFFGSAFLAMLATVAATPTPPPAAKALWTIASDDCVSVHTDGEPWDECGFQAFAMNADGTRVLTVSARGTIQLWDSAGREVRRIDWPDQPSGASGSPGGRAIVSGNIGVAITHYNQIAVIDLASGKILSQRVAQDVMTIDELRFVSPHRLLARGKDEMWKLGIREIALPTGEVREISNTNGWTTFESLGRKVWLTGRKAPFKVHARPPAGTRAAKLWTCAPVEEHFCFKRDLKGRYLHVVDLRQGGGRSVDAGRNFTEYDIVDFVLAAGRPVAVTCGPDPGEDAPRACKLFDLYKGRAFHAFGSDNLRAVGGVDELGRPEVRLALHHGGRPGEDRRVTLDGTVRVIDKEGRANISEPGGGLLVPIDKENSLLVDVDGRPVVRFPFHAQRCGNGWPNWSGFCRFSADGRRWLVPVRGPRAADSGVKSSGLTLFEVPVGAR